MAYNYVTVSGTFATLTGTVTFTPPDDVTDLTGTVPVLGPAPAVCTVSGGSFTSPALLGTDNVGLLPAGWSYLATVALTGQKAYSYPVLVPAANGTTATLSALPVSASGGGNTEGFNNPMTARGDVISGGASGAATRVAGNTSGTRKFFTQTGTGSASAAPAWGTVATTDLPSASTSGSGIIQIDGTTTDIQQIAVAGSAGSSGLAADAKHAHPFADRYALQAGYYAWTGDSFTGSMSRNPANIGIYQVTGAICITRLDTYVPATLNGFLTFSWLPPTGGTNAYVGLYDSGGTLLWTSSDLSGSAASIYRLNTGITSFGAGPYYVASLLGTQGGTSGGLGFFSGGLTLSGATIQRPVAPWRCASKTGVASSLPTTVTLSSFTQTYYYVFAALD